VPLIERVTSVARAEPAVKMQSAAQTRADNNKGINFFDIEVIGFMVAIKTRSVSEGPRYSLTDASGFDISR
jgi:hypothetical protein